MPAIWFPCLSCHIVGSHFTCLLYQVIDPMLLRYNAPEQARLRWPTETILASDWLGPSAVTHARRPKVPALKFTLNQLIYRQSKKVHM